MSSIFHRPACENSGFNSFVEHQIDTKIRGGCIKMETVFGDLPTLETDRLLLRKIELEDKEDIYAYTSNEEVSKYVTWDTHKSLADTSGFIEFVLAQYRVKKIAPWGIEYKENGKLIGTIDFVMWQPNYHVAEIGYCLSQDYWGMGIVTEAANEVIKYGFTHMDLVRIQARCMAENIGSARVMEKIGMSFEGVMRKAMYTKGFQRDIKMYSILDEEFFASP